MRLILVLAALSLSACATPSPVAKTSHPCPAFGQNMSQIETGLTAAGR